ncbi:GNAT family N-acetyltransferase [Streptococcus suis]|uniref:GNAT family N-acetyltransferase n=1 Tax=Streptococcus suis TaxID=1307 RepID=UPI000CF41518|nr:GNAT family N-acetyltransferase [Streptococcus suis]HEL1949859.1 GNAT family N-acetyltransferase [Streptococcus suis]HEL2725362.1 GNAT family N-acetyltransferase [Streptococcus suis]HEM3571207.1 GNAT family N-acetyltransferase [Streptococcus suis]HEM4733169.1 GNAT family N-acetyltransferase [Streptococcus suis]HEM6245244.1 GNAT family N-acetyltransferase [Streptococcus suis]
MFRGSGMGSNLVKLVIDDLANRNSKAFQIAVEEEKLGTWKLYRKLVLKNRTG